MSKTKILITAGGTSEKIDEVRRITNTGTGATGALIAEEFCAALGPAAQIIYLCSENAVRPRAEHFNGASISIELANDVHSLIAAIKTLCAETKFDIIVHSMAVSDFYVHSIADTEGNIGEGKISSDKESLVITLKKAPKAIASLRELAPEATIVGFKLLSGVSEQELVAAGLALLQKNSLDFVLANDTKTALDSADEHTGYLVAPGGTYKCARGKSEIAKLLIKQTLTALQ